jgi:hypothetical protein
MKRQRSAETDNRYLRREVKALNTLIGTLLRGQIACVGALLQELNDRSRIGSQMSNLCFNGKQQNRIPADVRETMRVCQEAWDGITRVKVAK